MKRHVGVGVPCERLAVRNADPTEDHVVTWTERMNVQARTGPHVAKCGRLDRFSPCEVLRGRQLDVASLAREHADFHAGPFGDSCVIGKIVSSLRHGSPMGLEQGRERKSLRSLYQTD